MMDYIYASTPAEGVDHVRLPGDPEKERALLHGWRTVSTSTQIAGIPF